jgi:hypothetical protein
MPPRARDAAPVSLRGWAEEAQAAAGIARALAPTAFVPEHLRVYTNPEERDPALRVLDLDGTVHQVTAVLLAGQELELGPMASLRAFVIIRGTVALFAVAARALLLHAGHEVVVVESTSSRAIVRGRRKDSPNWQTSTWDTDRARVARLLPGLESSNWRKQPKAMLVARATAEVCRWVAADALLGLPLLAEEVDDDYAGMQDQPDDDQADPPQRGTRRKATVARAALPAAAPPLPEQQPTPEPPSTAPPKGTPLPTKPQMSKLHAGLREIGVLSAAEGLALVSAWAGRRIDNTGHLSRVEITTVLDRLDALLAVRAGDDHKDQPPGEAPGEPDSEAADQEAAPDDEPE